MMVGNVRSRHITLPITFRNPDDTLSFVVDTGFTGYLTLPINTVHAMGLPFRGLMEVQLADASFVEVAVHEATILWKGVETQVRVFATGDRPLLGTDLLDGSELLAQFREEGLVTIDDLY